MAWSRDAHRMCEPRDKRGNNLDRVSNSNRFRPNSTSDSAAYSVRRYGRRSADGGRYASIGGR